MAKNNHAFTKLLLNWYDRNKRDLPWRTTRDPYIIWLSEIILQQTRVAQGTPYFNKFVSSYPSVLKLAEATEQQVLSLWQGLGYYSRARNLLACAQMVADKYNGAFPSTYEELVKLKGIGPYTAAAISSIAFKEKVPVIDGNVYRVVSRVFGIYEDIAQASSRKVFLKQLVQVISDERPGDFNQAIMEFGALQCVPVNPDCNSCDLKSRCYAFRNEEVSRLPVKGKKTRVRERFFNYLVFENDGMLLFNERKKKDIWQGLHDFYDIEKDEICSKDHLENEVEKLLNGIEWELFDVSETYKHILTHRIIYAQFISLAILNRESFYNIAGKLELKPVDLSNGEGIPKPILITKFLKSKNCLFNSSVGNAFQAEGSA